ncbi:serine hydrolase domain-containing protein [Photobacterium alginatilyticum]|uniref:serine hydrolase domain-containing protein n=1 Tax=Photobacterium alginatilyticum TaxID=1775171 RepID=UPI004069010C
MKLRIKLCDWTIGSPPQQRSGLIRLIIYSLCWVLCFLLFPAKAIASDVDPYVGIYKADIGLIPYTVIKKHGQRYFAHVSPSSVELVIDETGKFKAKHANIDIYGQFKKKQDGRYQLKAVSLYGVRHVYRREALEPQRYISALYSDSQAYSEFSHPSSEQCAAPYPDGLVASEKWLKRSPQMQSLVSKIEGGRLDYGMINSLLILKDGELVFERYFNGWQASEPHMMLSMSKSLTSLLVGMAVKQGAIKDINQSAVDYLSDYKMYFQGDRKRLTLRHLLTMSPSLYWDNWLIHQDDSPDSVGTKFDSEDSIAYVLSQPLSTTKGSIAYSGRMVSVMGEILRVASKQPSVSEYARKGPLSALCFQNAFWVKQKDQRSNVAGGVVLRPRDMLKLGQLVLNEGEWNGKQLFDNDWMNESMNPALSSEVNGNKYNYFWWNSAYYHQGKKYPAIKAVGYGGQEIAIVKDLDLVVVKTANSFFSGSLIDKIMANDVLPTLVK